MSRPQFPVNTPMHTISGPVVNGGLIDFQDNFHRGVAEYANYQQAQQQLMSMQQFPSQLQAFHPGMGTLPLAGTGAMPGVQAAPAQLPCISGPPAFFHVHGQKYVPEESVNAAKTVVSAPKPVATEAPEPRVLSEDEIERRVRERVDAWAVSQRKPVYSSDSRRHMKSRPVSDEERAAEHIHNVNAGMRGRFHSPL